MHVILGFAERGEANSGKDTFDLTSMHFLFAWSLFKPRQQYISVCRLYLSSWNWELIVYPIEQWELPFYVMVAVATKFQVEENVYPTSQQNKLKELFFICTISWKC